MDNIEDSDLDAFLPENYTPDQLKKEQASDSQYDNEEIFDGDDEEGDEAEVGKSKIKSSSQHYISIRHVDKGVFHFYGCMGV